MLFGSTNRQHRRRQQGNPTGTPAVAQGGPEVKSYETLKRAAVRRGAKLRQHREAVLRYLGASMTVQEHLAWELLDELCVLDPASLLFGRSRIGNEQWWSDRTGQPMDVSFVRVPVPRNWSPLWIVYGPDKVLLSKYRPTHVIRSVPYCDPRLFSTLEGVLTHLGLPVRFDA